MRRVGSGRPLLPAPVLADTPNGGGAQRGLETAILNVRHGGSHDHAARTPKGPVFMGWRVFVESGSGLLVLVPESFLGEVSHGR